MDEWSREPIAYRRRPQNREAIPLQVRVKIQDITVSLMLSYGYRHRSLNELTRSVGVTEAGQNFFNLPHSVLEYVLKILCFAKAQHRKTESWCPQTAKGTLTRIFIRFHRHCIPWPSDNSDIITVHLPLGHLCHWNSFPVHESIWTFV